VIFLVNRW